MNDDLFKPKHSVERARQLRLDSTKTEKLLWSRLRASRCGFKFRRQHPVEDYVLDFYCSEARLAVELDGWAHDNREDRDRVRQEFLESLGIHFLRYFNDEVLSHPDAMAEDISRVCFERVESG